MHAADRFAEIPADELVRQYLYEALNVITGRVPPVGATVQPLVRFQLANAPRFMACSDRMKRNTYQEMRVRP